MLEKFLDSDADDVLKQQASSIYESLAVLCCDLGTDDAILKTANLANLGGLSGGRLNCMVFLANLSEMEQEAINRWDRDKRVIDPR